MRVLTLLVVAILGGALAHSWQGLRCDTCGGGPVCHYAKTCCNGECVNLDYDTQNCGECGNVCQQGETCMDGCCVSDGAGVTYSWEASEWSECSVPCGNGTQTRTVVCRSSTGDIVEESLCASEDALATEQACSSPACTWQASEWSHCSRLCGPGTQTRTVECVNANGTAVEESFCDAELRPETSQGCGTVHCYHRFNREASEWSECSVPCGNGTQTRTVVCRSADGDIVADRFCAEREPLATEQACSSPACTWQASEWGSCSLRCGGTRNRTVECATADGTVVDESFCDPELRPETSQNCAVKHCYLTYSWEASEWSECSVPCGNGTQTRTVVCRSSKGDIVDEEFCSSEEPLATEQACSSPACTWQASDWSDCSVSCGYGTQNRTVECVTANASVVDESFCDPELRPATHQTCKLRPCYYEYSWSVEGPVGYCSAKCGGGVQSLNVTCRRSDGAVVVASFCDEATRPNATQPCNTQACYDPSGWFGNWEFDRSGSCDKRTSCCIGTADLSLVNGKMRVNAGLEGVICSSVGWDFELPVPDSNTFSVIRSFLGSLDWTLDKSGEEGPRIIITSSYGDVAILVRTSRSTEEAAASGALPAPAGSASASGVPAAPIELGIAVGVAGFALVAALAVALYRKRRAERKGNAATASAQEATEVVAAAV